MTARAPMSKQQDSAATPGPARPTLPAPPSPPGHRSALAPLTDPATQLRHLAESEQDLAAGLTEDWPQYVERSYHEGRRSAFSQAVAIIDQATLEGELTR